MATEKKQIAEIKLLGQELEQYRQNLDAAMAQLGISPKVAQVTDSDTITQMGVMQTPGLVVDGAVKAYGKVLSIEQLIAVLQ